MTGHFDAYAPLPAAFDEAFGPTGVRSSYTAVRETLEGLSDAEVQRRAEYLSSSYLDQGVTFDIGGEERPFPLDIVPRLIDQAAWQRVEAGVAQRVRALETFLDDIYGEGQIFRDGVIPRRVVTSSPHFLRAVMGLRPPAGVRVHVSGIDLIRDAEGTFRVLEDNVRIPSGVSYVMTNRRAMSAALPEVFADQRIRPVAHYPSLLLAALRATAPTGIADPTVVVLTPGVYNAAYFEHALLARLMGVRLVEGSDLVAQAGKVYVRTTHGLHPVDVIYRRVDDDFLDPVHFRRDSVLGVPGLLHAARAGNVTIANAVGNGVADDKLVYTYVPDLVRYYLGEEPLLPNVDTWRMEDPQHRAEVLDRLDELVLKPVDGSGGKGIVIGPRASRAEIDDLRTRLLADPRGWIAQPVVQLSTVPTYLDGRMVPRHVDLRPFAVHDGQTVSVLPGGLTRVALPEGELIVNSSQGGGSKDTWVLAGAGPLPPLERAEAQPGPRHPSVRTSQTEPAPAPRGQSQSQSQGRGRSVQTQTQGRGRAVQGQVQGLAPGATRSGDALMLSRIAEALFWIGRYVERAEGTARVLDVHLQLLIEDPTTDEETTCRALLSAMGLDPGAGPVDRRAVLRMLLEDPSSPSSVAWAVAAARENARRSREVVSTEVWEAINTTYNRVQSGRLARDRAADSFRMVREWAAVTSALADTSLSHDAGWHFLVLGRSLERVDLSARLMLARSGTDAPDHGWQVTLRCLGAHHAFTRTYHAIESPRGAAEFLLLDRLFPRSVVFGLTQASACLEALDPRQPRLGFGSEAAKIIGRARVGLEVASVTELLARLPQEMRSLQTACAQATDAVTRRYFEGAVAPEWLGGTT